jgi:hypothetical protein
MEVIRHGKYKSAVEPFSKMKWVTPTEKSQHC